MKIRNTTDYWQTHATRPTHVFRYVYMDWMDTTRPEPNRTEPNRGMHFCICRSV